MDQHLPAPITAGLRRRQVDCVTAEEDGSKRLADPELLARATGMGRVLVTMDNDFLAIAPEWQAAGRDFAGIGHVNRWRVTHGQAIEQVDLVAQTTTAEQMRNELVRIPL